MRILYVSRHFNHSGYEILDRLIREGIPPVGVVLHATRDPWRHPVGKHVFRATYRAKCAYYRCRPLRTLRSEETLARRASIPIIWTRSIKSDDFFVRLQKAAPDIIVLGGGWHELIPERVFEYPRLGCLNTHPSLLPEFRGTSITRWQVLHGVRRSGSTIHYVDDRFDTGGVLAQQTLTVAPSTTPQELFLQLGRLGADLMVPLLRRFEREDRRLGTYIPEHDRRYYQYFSRWRWELDRLRMDWSRPLRDIHYHVLANTQESYEYLGPYFEFRGERFFVRRTRLLDAPAPSPANEGVDGEEWAPFVQEVHADGGIVIARPGDPHRLELIQMQAFDRRYQWRRAWPAARLLRVRDGDRFTTSAE